MKTWDRICLIMHRLWLTLVTICVGVGIFFSVACAWERIHLTETPKYYVWNTDWILVAFGYAAGLIIIRLWISWLMRPTKA